MALNRRFRFACQINQPFDGRSWPDTFREIEALGYSTVFVPDHFSEGAGPISAMAAAAAVTTTLKVGALVFDCDFRHPAVLAREIATIDQIAEGRVEMGIGAGWMRADYDKSGIPMDRSGVRVSRMIEHAAVLRGLWGEGTFSFHGDFYDIEDLDGSPAPYTAGGPPLLIGGGAPRVLRFAGGTADIVGVNPSIHSGEIDAAAAQDGLPSAVDRKVGWVKEGAGDRFDALELNAWLAVAAVTDDAAGFATVVGEMFGGASGDDVLGSPVTLIGSASEIEGRLHERRERWDYSYHVIPGDQADAFAPIVAELTGS